jgi:hypothetical protein
MSDQSSIDRFKADMPHIPGVKADSLQTRRKITFGHLVTGFLFVLLITLVGVRWALRPKPTEAVANVTPPQMEIRQADIQPISAPTIIAVETQADQVIARVTEMARPWSSKDFVYRDATSHATTPALLLRLPVASATHASGYWAVAMNAAYGNCRLEYLTDLSKLDSEYGYHGAKHPMLGNPCSGTVIDPLKLSSLPGRVWVRGGIVQGSDVRPPLAIEVKIKGQNIIANRME